MYRIGIDVGGTNLAAGVVSESGTLCSRISCPVDHTLTDRQLCRVLAQLAREAAQQAGCSPAQIGSVGIGVPGQADQSRGIVTDTPNLVFHNTPLRELFQQEWQIPVFLGNDADCAAVGEFRAGAARNVDSMVLVTIGTGIGAGLILNGKLFPGCAGSGMEVGHMVTHPHGIPCSCGGCGCWEQYASATALVRMAVQAAAQTPESSLVSLCAGQLDRMNGKMVFDAAAKGDPTARQVLSVFREELSYGLINLVNTIQPRILCLGGGISNAPPELLLEPLRELVRAGCYDKTYPTRLETAELGNDAGMVGAAFLAETV